MHTTKNRPEWNNVYFQKEERKKQTKTEWKS